LPLITRGVIIFMSIRSFRCRETQTLFELERVARFASVERPALRKLKQLDLARRIEDMCVPPGNRLERSPETGRGT